MFFDTVHTFTDEGVSHFQRSRQVFHQRTKKFIAGTPRRSLGNVPQRLFDSFAIGDVTNDDGCFGLARMILVEGAGYFTKKRRAILTLVKKLTAEAPGAYPFFQ